MTKLKWFGIGFVACVVIAFVLFLIGIIRVGNGTDGISKTNVIYYTNIIYESRPAVIVPEIGTNGTEVCLDGAEYWAIYNDYMAYSTNTFSVWSSNNSLSITLHKRTVRYKLKTEAAKRWIVGVGYSFASPIPVNLLAGYRLFDWLGIYATTSFDRLGIGALIEF